MDTSPLDDYLNITILFGLEYANDGRCCSRAWQLCLGGGCQSICLKRGPLFLVLHEMFLWVDRAYDNILASSTKPIPYSIQCVGGSMRASFRQEKGEMFDRDYHKGSKRVSKLSHIPIEPRSRDPWSFDAVSYRETLHRSLILEIRPNV